MDEISLEMLKPLDIVLTVVTDIFLQCHMDFRNRAHGLPDWGGQLLNSTEKLLIYFDLFWRSLQHLNKGNSTKCLMGFLV